MELLKDNHRAFDVVTNNDVLLLEKDCTKNVEIFCHEPSILQSKGFCQVLSSL